MSILVKKANINNVSLQASTSPSGSSSMQVSSNIEVYNSPNSTLFEDLSGLRIRLIASFSEDTAKNMDYLTQRYNEFNQDERYEGTCTTYKFNKYLKKAVGNSNLLTNGAVFSPFASNSEQLNMMFRHKSTPIGDGNKIPKNLLMYDCLLQDLTPKKSDGTIEVLGRDSTIQEIKLSDVAINFDNHGADFKNLSVYLYVYMPSFYNTDTQLDYSINTGMSIVDSLCLRGLKTSFLTISNENLFVGMRTSTIAQEPDNNKLDVLSPVDTLSLDSITSQGFVSFRNRLLGSLGTNGNDLRKVVSSSNYVSDLWISRDSLNNNKLLFAIDLASYLAENSSHPFLYDNKDLANAMISGASSLAPKNLSSIKDITVYRRFCSPSAIGSSNSLGTSSKNVPLGPSETFPRVPLRSPRLTNLRISDQDSDQDDKRIQFFEVDDIINTQSSPNRQINGLFRYEIEFSVYDSSCKFLRNVANKFIEIKTNVNNVYEELVNGRYRDSSGSLVRVSSTGQILTSLREITFDNTSGISLYDYVLSIVQEYDNLINSFNASEQKIDIAQAYGVAMEKDFGKINISLLAGLEVIVQVGIDFVTKSLLQTYPDNPYGTSPDLTKRSPRMGTLPAYRIPLSTALHIFSDTVEIGKNFNFGLDYVAPDYNSEGLSSIGFDQYDGRRELEFKKYFQTGKASSVSIPPGPYRDSSYAYFTPQKIASPNRNVIIQTNFVEANGLSVNYDLGRYALLFKDIIDFKTMTKDGGRFYVNLPERLGEQVESNRLFSGVSGMLLEKYGVTITDITTEDFSPPRVVTGSPKNTITATGEDKCGDSKGFPLIPTILGGLNSLEAKSYLLSINTAIKNKDILQLAPSILESISQKQLSGKPIKLAFSLLGELEIKSKTTTSEKNNTSYNSFTDLRKTLGINKSNVKEKIESSPISEMPNQIKSMLAIASTPDVLPLGNFETGLSFDVCRPRLMNPVKNESSGDLVSFFSDDEDIPPYQQAQDPMKSYSNFLAFWMNYKQICVIEYLDGFGDLEVNEDTYGTSSIPYTASSKLALSRWLPLSEEIISRAKQGSRGGMLLCRVRQLQPSDYVSLLSQTLSQKQIDEVSRFFELGDKFKMPLYNKYFYLGGSSTVFSEESVDIVDDIALEEINLTPLVTTGY